MPQEALEVPPSGFHSQDFSRLSFSLSGEPYKIGGKTKEEWEKEFDVVGAIEHLKELGWSNYQWRYTSPDSIVKVKAETGFNMGSFAEFFSPYYHGYLRGDGDTVKAAVASCLAEAQKMAKCERRNGHNYLVRGGTRLIRCDKCGFGGFSTQVDTLTASVRNLRIHNKILQEENLKIYEQLRAAGFRWGLKDGFETLEKIPTPKPLRKVK